MGKPIIVRDAHYLVVPQRWVDLPPRCLVCGAADSGRLRLKVRKASRALAFLGLFGATVYFSAPTARLRAALCRSHRNSEQVSRLPTRLLLGGSLIFIAAAFYYRTPEAMLLGGAGPLLLIQLAMMYEIAREKLISVAHADRGYVWLEGVSADYLSQIPEISPPTPDTAA
jgi:hypothetical protein